MDELMDKLRATLHTIEHDLAAGTYQPGPWLQLVRAVRRLPAAERAALADDIDRVSNRLHQRRNPPTLPFGGLVALELVVLTTGLIMLRFGLRYRSLLLMTLAVLALSLTFQPLIKVVVGSLLGIRYAYGYIKGAEGAFKLRYGRYLAVPRWRRVLFHASGTIGTPLAFGLVGTLARPKLSRFALVNRALALYLGIFQLVWFVLGLLGVQRVRHLRVAQMTSGGAAGDELRDLFT